VLIQRDPKCYRLLVLEQGTFAVGDLLSEVSLPATTLQVDRLPWSESVGLVADRAFDLLLSVASSQSDQARSLIAWVGRLRCLAPVLAVLPADASEELLGAASKSVDDFVLWPVQKGELQQRIARMLGLRQDLDAVKNRLIGELGLSSLVGIDPAFLRAVETIPRMAASDGTVVITGETGTGKELCARAIHHLSRRRSFPFIPVDCGAFPEQLLENELFGHSRGAFTDARGDQRGLAAIAEGGTLFLDEIDSLSLSGQAKLLRFLEDRAFKPLGAERFTKADVRIVTATNRNLESCMRAGQFRSDLFFRLNVFRLRMPPLRERPGDIVVLAQHLLDSLTGNAGRPGLTFSQAATHLLEAHDWPGNVRELFNVVQRAAAFCTGRQILAADISLGETESTRAEIEPQQAFRHARARVIEDFERTYVQDLLFKHHGNITRAAYEAEKDRRAFGRLVKKHGVARLGRT
jgi:two-component system, NtrC family, response regulator GlrR